MTENSTFERFMIYHILGCNHHFFLYFNFYFFSSELSLYLYSVYKFSQCVPVILFLIQRHVFFYCCLWKISNWSFGCSTSFSH